jgi:hypothetical protein
LVTVPTVFSHFYHALIRCFSLCFSLPSLFAQQESSAAPDTSGEGNGTSTPAAQASEDIVTCVWAGHDFYPVFRIVDDLSGGSSDVYNGSYRLTIVAGKNTSILLGL